MKPKQKIATVVIFAGALAAIFGAPQTFAQTWSRLASGTINDLNDVFCFNESTCLAVGGAPFIGGDGVILRTTNGGGSWSAVSIPLRDPLRAVHCPIASVCYAVGDNGAVLKSANGGASWARQSAGTAASTPWFWDVWAASESSAVAVGNAGAIYRTINGGATWTQVSSGTSNNLHGVYFINGSIGWAMGSGGKLLKTINGGLTWLPLTSGSSGLLWTAVSLSDGSVWVVGDDIRKNPSGSLIWTGKHEQPGVVFRGISFADAGVGWAVGGNGTIVKTIDGGNTWTAETSGTNVILRGISCAGAVCFAVGDDGVILKHGAAASIPSPISLAPAPSSTSSTSTLPIIALPPALASSTPASPLPAPPPSAPKTFTPASPSSAPPLQSPPKINLSGKRLFKTSLTKNQKKKVENFGKNNPAKKRGRGIILNRNILKENLFDLNLFDDVTLTAEVSKRQSKSGKTVVSGAVSGLPESSFTIVQKGNAVAGNVRTKEGIYEIRSVGGGVQVVQFIDTELLPEDAHPNQPPVISASAPPEEPATVAPFEADLFVGYTRDVTASFGGGLDAVVTAIELAVEEANETYENSNIPFRLRLVKTGQITYRDSGNLQDDLNFISDTSISNNRRRNDVQRPRNNSRADLYTLLVKDGGGFCGIAWQMDQSNYQTFSESAFSVVDVDCLSNLTLPHEIGHNMGAGHDRDNAQSWPLNPTYSYGYRSAEDGFRTVMAYACPREEGIVKTLGCPRVKYFSSATNTYRGKPLGSDNVNNARTLGNTARRVSEFRQRR